MRILGIETHYLTTSGDIRLSAVDWWRVVNPLTHLAKNTNHKVDFIKRVVDPGKDDEVEWGKIGKKYDLIWSSYNDNPKAYAYIKALNSMYGTKYNMDLDDDIFDVDQMNPAILKYNRNSEAFQNAVTILQDAQYSSVTTPHLQQRLMIELNKIPEILPNYIDPDVYKYDSKKVPDNGKKIIIGYQGSATHFTDLMSTGVLWAIRRLMLENKNVYLAIMGTAFEELADYFPKGRYIPLSGSPDHNKWRELWQELPFDIGIAPLVNTSFNRGKSNIKWQEYSLRKIPGVYSMVEPYRDSVVENDTGFLAEDEEEWYEKLSWLIANKKLRKLMGERAREEVLANWTIQKHWKKWNKYVKTL